MLEAMSSLLIYFSINMLSAPVLFIPTPSPTSCACALTNPPQKKGQNGKYILKGNVNKYLDCETIWNDTILPLLSSVRATMSWWWEFQGGGGSAIKPKSLLGNYSGGCISGGCKAGRAAPDESFVSASVIGSFRGLPKSKRQKYECNSFTPSNMCSDFH